LIRRNSSKPAKICYRVAGIPESWIYTWVIARYTKNLAPGVITGIWYVGTDIPQGAKVPSFNEKVGEYTFADKLRKVELRFGANGVGKAYRYINGYTGIPASNNYTFAHALS